MAKRAKNVDSGKTRIEVRFDSDFAKRVDELAESAGISVNQLMQGVMRWAVDHAHVGEAEQGDGPCDIETKPVPGCLWFGDKIRSEFEEEIVFSLDFTERRVVREPETRKRKEGGK